MVSGPDTIAPKADVMTALVGIVSIRDIYASLRAELEDAVLECDAFLGTGRDDEVYNSLKHTKVDQGRRHSIFTPTR